MRAGSVYMRGRTGYSFRWAEEYKVPLFHTSIAHRNKPRLLVPAINSALIALPLFFDARASLAPVRRLFDLSQNFRSQFDGVPGLVQSRE